MAQHNEIEFEKEICEHLAAHGWEYSPNDAGYDKERALYPADLFGWLEDTQPKELAKVVKADAPDVAKQRVQVLDRLVKVLDTPMSSGGGTLHALRVGFRHVGAAFRLCQFRPESTLNAATVEDYEKVRLRVMRQVHFSTADQRSVDLVFFVNGLPVATAELKTDFTQSVGDAIAQYRDTRQPQDPKTRKRQPLFESGARALVHFAVSNDEVWMTTRLRGDATHFLPFNRGTESGGAGNPINPHGSATSYLWERVLQRDAWLEILGRFMYVKTERSIDPISGKRSVASQLRFPRFHQWEAVTALVAAATEGPGHRYLVQHSAGSGKTDSIAWLSHRLARLQVDNSKVFDSVIVVTDRNVLDAQLQDAIKQIDNDQGIVAAIDASAASREGVAKSGLLAKSLTDGKLIIVVTIQTFPFALAEIRANQGLAGKSFAVIADEAHSSQSGQVAAKLKQVLTAEELQQVEDGGEIDVESVLAAEASDRADASTISYFAFTATPKAKTLELFGRPPAEDPSGLPEPYHLYTMKQAIEEGYILDVLRGYHSYSIAFQVGQNASAGGDEEVDQSEANKQVMRWVKLNPQTIAQKAAIMVEHFRTNVAHLLDGHAKAMVVSDSRKAAVRYKLAIDAYIAERGYGYGTLVAFSGSVEDPQSGPEDFTESTMNRDGRGRPVHDLRTAFKDDEFSFMIVANKFQTGFDQPLLCAMYVDRLLSGVTAVQTLSRLNRTYVTPDGEPKTALMTQVVDFVNDPEKIRESFEPYFVGAYLETATDPNLVHDIAAKLDTAAIYTPADVTMCAAAFLSGQHSRMKAALDPARREFSRRWAAAHAAEDESELDVLEMFRRDVGSFVNLYAFMSQIVDYGSGQLEALHIYLSLLQRLIRPDTPRDEIDLSELDLRAVKQVDRGAADIKLVDSKGLQGVSAAGSGQRHDPTMVAFQQVLDRLNDLFGDEEFTPSQKVSFVEALGRSLLDDESLVQQARVNSPQQFADSPDFDEAVQGVVADNQGAYNKMADYFFSNSPGRAQLVVEIAEWFYALANQSTQ
jgi:type I restriction enzyme R subunit